MILNSFQPSTGVIDISNATVVLASNSFVYDGQIKTQNVTSVTIGDTTLVANRDYVVSGNVQYNAGTHTLKIIGQGNYSGIKEATWNIAKANATISIDVDDITVMTNNTGTIIVTTNSDGVITATSSNTSRCTTSVSGNVITVTGISAGSATITINVAASTNYNVSSNVTCSVTIQSIPSVLANATPAQIQAAAQLGIASSIWSVGDRTASISIGAVGNMSATSACAFIIGFNHNSELEGTGIHFQFGKTTGGTDIAFVDSGYNTQKSSGTWFNMNNSSTNSGGWNGSRMRTTVCPAFLSALPSEWQNVISTCTKYTDNTGNSSTSAANVTATTDSIWLLAEKEVFGSRSYANTNESSKQAQYQYYINGNTKVKYKHNATSTACIWWLRSPGSNYSNRFVDVRNAGSVDANGANLSYGFAPGFKIS